MGPLPMREELSTVTSNVTTWYVGEILTLLSSSGKLADSLKIRNKIFHPTKPEVIGVLDWELSTLVSHFLPYPTRPQFDLVSGPSIGPSLFGSGQFTAALLRACSPRPRHEKNANDFASPVSCP